LRDLGEEGAEFEVRVVEVGEVVEVLVGVLAGLVVDDELDLVEVLLEGLLFLAEGPTLLFAASPGGRRLVQLEQRLQLGAEGWRVVGWVVVGWLVIVEVLGGGEVLFRDFADFGLVF
jgi:hypothetical protein